MRRKIMLGLMALIFIGGIIAAGCSKKESTTTPADETQVTDETQPMDETPTSDETPAPMDSTMTDENAAATEEATADENAEANAEAIKVAEAWLAVSDNGDYAASYDEAAAPFQAAIKKDDYVTQMTGVRTPLGKLVSRKVLDSKYMTSMPGAPDGEYVVIQFETSFENKKEAIETVTPMKGEDGQWKVSGYYIK